MVIGRWGVGNWHWVIDSGLGSGFSSASAACPAQCSARRGGGGVSDGLKHRDTEDTERQPTAACFVSQTLPSSGQAKLRALRVSVFQIFFFRRDWEGILLFAVPSQISAR
jgi:hypothetical protein